MRKRVLGAASVRCSQAVCAAVTRVESRTITSTSRSRRT